MIIPTALVDRWPLEKYYKEGQSIEEALKTANLDLLNIYKELNFLIEEAIKIKPADIDIVNATKEEKKAYKILTNNESKYGQLVNKIDTLKSDFIRMIKKNDYAAMIMASYPSSKFLDKSKYWNEFKNIQTPILIRGISNYIIGKHAREIGNDYYFIETGYLGNYYSENNQSGRKNFHRIVKNSMQHSTIMDVPDDRWKSLVDYDPKLEYTGWKKKGSKILIVLSTEKPFKAFGEDKDIWIENVISTLSQHTDREIVFREKTARNDRSSNTIYNAFDDDIYAVVTYNSIAAVEAIQYGIPSFSLAPTAADPVGNKDLTKIESPNMPDEDIIQKWLHSLAYSQFNLEEIITGKAWELVLENEKRSTINS